MKKNLIIQFSPIEFSYHYVFIELSDGWAPQPQENLTNNIILIREGGFEWYGTIKHQAKLQGIVQNSKSQLTTREIIWPAHNSRKEPDPPHAY